MAARRGTIKKTLQNPSTHPFYRTLQKTVFYRTLLQLFGVERFYRTGYLLQNCSVERIL